MALGMSELDAFRAYAESYPDDTLLLVDTIDTLGSGVPNAIKVFEELRRKGHEPVGIRLDSGDLAYLTLRSARMLDQAGFPNTSIVLSNNLDELVMWQITSQIRQEAPREGLEAEAVIKRLVFGVGTQLITSAGESALGGVYKLVALQRDGDWTPALKVSDSKEKTANPGFKRAWRFYDERGKATADVLALQDENLVEQAEITLRHPSDFSKWRTVRRDEVEIEPLHVDILKAGRLVYNWPDLAHIRETRLADVARLDVGVRRLIHPHIYHVSLSDGLWNLKQELLMRARGARK